MLQFSSDFPKTILTFALVTTLLITGSSFAAYQKAQAASTNPTPVYRFYKYKDGAHFYTNNESEKSAVSTRPDVYRYEGVAFYTFSNQEAGTTPVYRFYNYLQGVHFYTNNESEYQNLYNASSWTFRYEGIAYYAYPGQGVDTAPVHRFYNFRKGVHFYTNNQSEASYINDTAGWTFRYEGIAYYLQNNLSFSGSGSQVTESFILPTGLSVAKLNYNGGSNFIVWLYKVNTGESVALLANEIGSANVSSPIGVGEDRYTMEIQSSGNWNITIEQPKSSSGYVSSFNGSDSQATQLFSMNAGLHQLDYSYSGSGNFIVYVLDSQGNYVDLAVNEIGSTSGGTYISVPSTGNYIMEVISDGSWSMTLH